MKKVKILSALSTASAVLVLAAGPVLAVGVEVSGNGAESTNTANVSATQTVNIYQTNKANISNSVDANANTGENTANKNTGGDVAIKTGDANTEVSLTNTANSNKTAALCCDPLTANLKLSGNGADSYNKVNFNIENYRNVTVENVLNIENNFEVGANTGGNEADENTNGDVRIETGDAWIKITIGNSGNSNSTTICCLAANVVNPPTPKPTPLPGMPAVLGVSKGLPVTGYNFPLTLIAIAVLGLVGSGLILRAKASSIEEFVTKLSSKSPLSA